ncbi:uncharacterized protein DUF4386 [Kribbella voronezhensis]|uniref:Uncharacterized protein DUF4386 n=1 Tax=Kribbella voronezhensis TaxID=2512212 RepID=A0A4V6Q5Y5_9ACTN|nr:DUF4386 domain-containing protein [Kribbella voronezhensis]TDU90323.1 uncharacterized protein DUF4386 [Kribbella voronezhensis]
MTAVLPAPRSRLTMPAPGLVAGVGLLVLAVLAALANFGVVERLVTEDDATRTALDISASESLFRWGIAALMLVVLLDVIVAWALQEFFQGVHRELSMLAAWLRVGYAAVFAVAVGQLIGVLRLSGDGQYLRSYSTDQLHTEVMLKVDAFHDIWTAGLVLFGAHLLLIGYLAYRSGRVPRLIGILVVIAGLGYLVDSFGAFLSVGYSLQISGVTFVGEALLMLWLLAKGRRSLLPA